MKGHRGIATISSALVVCFLALSHFEPQYFLLHLYESLLYVSVVLLLFYFEGRWAYMLGMVAPAVWLFLTYATGLLGGAMQQFSRLLHLEGTSNEVSLLAGVTAVLSVLLIVFCGYRWKREFAGRGESGKTFLVSLGVVGLYYATLVIWFWEMVPEAVTKM
jgi:hypothetical protein